MNTETTTTPRQCLTCGEFEGTTWVTAKCVFEDATPVAEYEPFVREQSYGAFTAGTRRVGGRRATDLCRHQHKTQDAASRCADNLAALRNAR